MSFQIVDCNFVQKQICTQNVNKYSQLILQPNACLKIFHVLIYKTDMIELISDVDKE